MTNTDAIVAFTNETMEHERDIYFAWKDAKGKRAQLMYAQHSDIILKVQAIRVKLGLEI